MSLVQLHPCDECVVVTEEMAGEGGQFVLMRHGKTECFEVGQKIWLSRAEFLQCTPVKIDTEGAKKSPWREFKTICGAYPMQDSNLYVVPPGESACIDLSLMECPPNRIYFNACGGCWAIDTKPITMEPTENLDGPMLNQQFLWVGEDPVTCETPEKVWIHNPNETPLTISAAFYC